MKKGRLIVIDGVDASGKTTQASLVAEALTAEGEKAETVSFPCYDREYSAPVRMYLGGELGSDPDDVNAYAASAFYAVDRYCSWKTEWGKRLDAGITLVAARYVTSNAIHQGEKLKKEDRKAYFTWLYDFEFDKLGLPRPDLVLFLDMPPEKSLELLTSRYGGDESKKDIHEKNSAYLFGCYDTALDAADLLGWIKIRCVDADGSVRPIAEITRELLDATGTAKEKKA